MGLVGNLLKNYLGLGEYTSGEDHSKAEPPNSGGDVYGAGAGDASKGAGFDANQWIDELAKRRKQGSGTSMADAFQGIFSNMLQEKARQIDKKPAVRMASKVYDYFTG
jgi:hypothetical protein